MAATQKRWLTQPNSKVAKVSDLSTVLRREDAWNTLDRETRQELYDCLPPPQEGEAPHNIDVHPLKTSLKTYIEEGIRHWHTDLIDGKEQKKWRENAFRAGQQRANGAWNDFNEQQREADWGKRETSEFKHTLDNAGTEKEARDAANAAATADGAESNS